MTGIDIETWDVADMPNGTAFVTHAYAKFGDDYPISGDMLAVMRADKKQAGG